MNKYYYRDLPAEIVNFLNEKYGAEVIVFGYEHDISWYLNWLTNNLKLTTEQIEHFRNILFAFEFGSKNE